jgi:hypothetical protein
MMIVNDDPRVVNNLVASLTDDARVVIYDRHVFIVQATGASGRIQTLDLGILSQVFHLRATGPQPKL